MEGFFDGADVVLEVVTPTPPIATQGVPAEVPILSTELVPIGEGTYTEGISETTPILAETLTPQEESFLLLLFRPKLLLLPHLSLSLPVIPSQLYLRPRRMVLLWWLPLLPS